VSPFSTSAAMPRHRHVRSIVGLAAVALGLFAVACGETSTSPTERPAIEMTATHTTTSTSITTQGTAVDALTWSKPVTQTTVSKVIGAAGGSFSIPNGIAITVPPGAVTSNVTFSVTRLPGSIVAYEFQPHGITFAVPLQVAQPTLGTNLFKLPAVASITGAYFLGSSALDQSSGTADVAEFESTFVSADRAWVRFSVKHFSGYLISTGRR